MPTAKDKAPATAPAVDTTPAPPEPPMAEVVTEPEPAKVRPFMSEGMRQDLETSGYAADPVSGARYTLDREANVVTVHDRSGAELDLFEWDPGV